MKVSKVKLTNYQVERLFEEFNKKLFIDGINPKYSYFMFKNSEYLATAFNNMMMELYDERRDPDYAKMVEEQNKLVIKYADKDEQANIVRDTQGNPVITENIVEFNNENEVLLSKYKDLVSKIESKEQYNHKIRSRDGEYDLITLELNEFPNSAPPFIVGLLGY